MWRIVYPTCWYGVRSKFLWFTINGYRAKMVNTITDEIMWRPVSRADIEASL